MRKLPVTIVSGFLGAGKTTLLNWLLGGEHRLRIAVLVNDFGSIDVDSTLISNVHGETIGLANGCVCCTIRDDLVRALSDLLGRGDDLDQIVIETSGVSDPNAAAMAIVMSPRLASRLRLDAIITVVDAENVLRLTSEHRALAVDQITAADIVVVNKRDLVGDAVLADVEAWVRSVAPRARLVPTEQCRVPAEILFDAAQRYAPTLELAHPPPGPGVLSTAARNPPHAFTSRGWQEKRPLALEPLYSRLQQLPPQVFRAKGTLYLADVPNRRVVLQVVGSRIQLSKGAIWESSETPQTRMVVLALGRDVDLGTLMAGFEHCVAAGDERPSNRLVEAVLNVLRAP